MFNELGTARHAAPRRLRLLIFGATLLLLVSVFKGVGGYMDLYDYLQNAVNLWTHGSMALPVPPGSPPEYNRFAPGLGVISGPFVYMGLLAERATGIDPRSVIALVIPILGSLAAVLLFEIGLLLEFHPHAALWSVIVFAVGSPFLSFTRMYYTEIAIVFFLFLGVWAWLRFKRLVVRQNSIEGLKGVKQPAPGLFHTFQLSSVGPLAAPGCRYLLLAGSALGTCIACHYLTAPIVAALAAVWACALCATNVQGRVTRVLVLVAPIVGVGLLLLLQNYLRWGNPFTTGYNIAYGAHTIFTIHAMPREFLEVLFQFVRTPWTLLVFFTWGALRTKEPTLAWSILAAFILQNFVWSTFVEFDRFAVRYELPLTALLAAGLPALGAALQRRWPGRGMIYAALVLIVSNLLWFLRTDDWSPSFQIMEDGSVYPFVWYRTSDRMGILQWSVLLGLLGACAALFALAWRKCNDSSRESIVP